MERKSILIEGIAGPKRIVQQIHTRIRTTTIYPLRRRRFKKDDQTVLVDLVKGYRITSHLPPAHHQKSKSI